ncbi:hypothetical protein GCM10010459_21680 [Microbacterium schleiferi]
MPRTTPSEASVIRGAPSRSGGAASTVRAGAHERALRGLEREAVRVPGRSSRRGKQIGRQRDDDPARAADPVKVRVSVFPRGEVIAGRPLPDGTRCDHPEAVEHLERAVDRGPMDAEVDDSARDLLRRAVLMLGGEHPDDGATSCSNALTSLAKLCQRGVGKAHGGLRVEVLVVM